MLTMPSCLTTFTARASAKKRSTISRFLAHSAFRTFTATRAPMPAGVPQSARALPAPGGGVGGRVAATQPPRGGLVPPGRELAAVRGTGRGPLGDPPAALGAHELHAPQ